MGELEPGPGERVLEGGLVVLEAARDLLVGGVEAQGEVGGEHARLPASLTLGHRDHVVAAAVDRTPLDVAALVLELLPLVGEEDVEELVVPAGRMVGPRDLDAAADRVIAVPGAEVGLPAQTLLFERGALGVGALVALGAGAVGLAEGVTAGDEGDGLLVVHRHPTEGVADVGSGLERIGLALRAFRVDVDETHRRRRQRLLQLAVARVALVGAQPFGLRAPVDVVVRLPDVLASAGEAEGLEAHLLEGDVAREDEEVGPGDLLAVLLLQRPQQTPGLVESDVVGPRVERGEALLALTAAAATVLDAVGARRVPGHADHERAVVAEVGGPPVLARALHLREVGLESEVVEAVELGRVVEVLIHRVAGRLVLREDLEVEAVGPPVGVGVALHRRGQGPGLGGRGCRRVAVDDRAAARGGGFGHGGSFRVRAAARLSCGPRQRLPAGVCAGSRDRGALLSLPGRSVPHCRCGSRGRVPRTSPRPGRLRIRDRATDSDRAPGRPCSRHRR
ncbi:Uncharacterised protein [Mycobacteroides abscessus subsp. abscessus]|nr:Uncharacterised protein [Mycobacteroides abscessus subsp. abscessus]